MTTNRPEWLFSALAASALLAFLLSFPQASAMAADPPPLQGFWMCHFTVLVFSGIDSQLSARLELEPVDTYNAKIVGGILTLLGKTKDGGQTTRSQAVETGTAYVPKGGTGGVISFKLKPSGALPDQKWLVSAVVNHSLAQYFDVIETVPTGYPTGGGFIPAAWIGRCDPSR